MMNYTAEHIDPQKFEEHLKDTREFQKQKTQEKIAEARAYCKGYEDALEYVRDMLHCSNYESPEKESTAHANGADFLMHILCKELGIESQDIRKCSGGIEDKAVMLATRIKEYFANNGTEHSGE